MAVVVHFSGRSADKQLYRYTTPKDNLVAIIPDQLTQPHYTGLQTLITVDSRFQVLFHKRPIITAGMKKDPRQITLDTFDPIDKGRQAEITEHGRVHQGTPGSGKVGFKKTGIEPWAQPDLIFPPGKTMGEKPEECPTRNRLPASARTTAS